MDLVAGLHWLRENLPAFGGDPERVTIMGHGTGAALANFLAVSPVARGLYKCIVYIKEEVDSQLLTMFESQLKPLDLET